MASPEERLETLEKTIQGIDRRLKHLEDWSRLRGAPPLDSRREPEMAPAPAARGPEAAQPARSWASRAEGIDLEELVGGRILAWVGGSAVLLGVVFFLVM